jgi:hypothetical protein
MNFWPFNKKITVKVSVEPTVSHLKKKSMEYTKSLREQVECKRVQKENEAVLNEIVSSKIDAIIKSFEDKNRCPYSEGDWVVPVYYGFPVFNGNHGWLPTAHSFVETFRKDGIDGPVPLKVKSCFVDSGWLYDKLDHTWNDYNIDLHRKVGRGVLEKLVEERIGFLRSKGEELVQYAVDIDWEFHKFPYKEGKNGWLDLKWGGFPAASVMPKDCEIAKEQAQLWEKESALDKARADFKNQESKLESIKKEFLNRLE